MQAVPLGFFLFLVELAAGGWLVTALLDWDGEVSPGFLLLNGVFLLAFGGAGLWLRLSLPAERMVGYPVEGLWLQGEVVLWTGFLTLAAIQLVLMRCERRGAARILGTAAALVGLSALVVSAAAYRPPALALPVVIASFLAGAAALGAVWSGMMLGHWYLVTPLLAPRPLLRLNAALAAILALQGVLVAGQLLSGAGAEEEAWLFWLRAGVGIAFPLGLALMIWRTARRRAMMSATGLLYIALGAVLSGEIIARSLFFLTQTAV
jgi:hypothetical protein